MSWYNPFSWTSPSETVDFGPYAPAADTGPNWSEIYRVGGRKIEPTTVYGEGAPSNSAVKAVSDAWAQWAKSVAGAAGKAAGGLGDFVGTTLNKLIIGLVILAIVVIGIVVISNVRR